MSMNNNSIFNSLTALTAKPMKGGGTYRLQIGWFFPLLALCSLIINSSMHPRKLRATLIDIEQGPSNVTTNIAITTLPQEKHQISTSGHSLADSRMPGKQHLDNPLVLPKSEKKESDEQIVSTAETGKVADNLSRTKEEEPTDRPAKNNQSAPPKAQALSSNATITSACLLVRDDNNIMNEWVAYHYHTLRMRRLIVAVDPNSETSPSRVLDPWKDHGRMEIDIWTDDMYMPEEFLNNSGIPPDEFVENITKFGDISFQEMMGINVHRYRQRTFLANCYRQLHKEGRSFVLHIDTDEYIVPNQLMRKVKKFRISPVKEPGSILSFIQQLVESDPTMIAYPCITVLRLLFGSIEKEDDKWAPMPSDGFDRSRFETLRWRYHGNIPNKKLHGHPKVLIDISKIPKRFLSNKVVHSIHRPFVKFCRGQGETDYNSFEKYPITANHYLGSWEQYNARNDTRRSWKMYKEKASLNDGEDHWTESWLEGFINDVGLSQAQHLLGHRYL